MAEPSGRSDLSARRGEIAVVTGQGIPLPVYAKAVLEALSGKGVSCHVLADGDEAVLGFDNVLLLGIFPRIVETGALLRTNRDPRRKVVGWAVEPLLPADLAGVLRRLGMAMTSARLGYPASVPAFRRLFRLPYHLIARFALGRYSGQIAANEAQFVFDQTAWVERGFAEGWLTRLLVSTNQKKSAMRASGHDALFAPVGHNAAEYGHDLGGPRDLDVLFLGRAVGRWRRGVLRRIVSDLRRRGASVDIRTTGVRGDDRTELLNRTRVILHLHKYPWDTPWMRWYLASANGAVVCSQPLASPQPLRPGIDYLSAEPASLGEEIVRLLDDEPARLAMLDSCRRRMAEEMSMEMTVDRVLEAFGLTDEEKEAGNDEA